MPRKPDPKEWKFKWGDIVVPSALGEKELPDVILKRGWGIAISNYSIQEELPDLVSIFLFEVKTNYAFPASHWKKLGPNVSSLLPKKF